jgi:ribonuclease P protein component
MSHTFSKHERLYKKKDIEELFLKGSYFYLYPFSVKFTTNNNQDHNAVLISASKRFFKKAIDRNLIKRRFREAYRLNKHLLEKTGFSISFVYSTKNQHDFGFIQERIVKILEKLNEQKL